MSSLKAFLAGVAVMASSALAATDYGGSDEMGPAAFLWPADRVWSAAMDNSAPCGSVASPGNRSEFPMTSAKVALVDQTEGFDLQLSISYLSNPTSNSNFNVLISSDEFQEIDVGHTCVKVPDAPSSVTAGLNATLQIKYISKFDSSENQTFYACADVTYVELTDFDETIPCFNATEPGVTSIATDGASESSAASTSSASASPDDSGSSKSGGGHKLSKGAIAGIVVGSVVGAAMILGAALVVYRRKSQRLAALRQQHSARGVAWEDSVPKDSQSAGSVRMNNL